MEARFADMELQITILADLVTAGPGTTKTEGTASGIVHTKVEVVQPTEPHKQHQAIGKKQLDTTFPDIGQTKVKAEPMEEEENGWCCVAGCHHHRHDNGQGSSRTWRRQPA